MPSASLGLFERFGRYNHKSPKFFPLSGFDGQPPHEPEQPSHVFWGCRRRLRSHDNAAASAAIPMAATTIFCQLQSISGFLKQVYGIIGHKGDNPRQSSAVRRTCGSPLPAAFGGDGSNSGKTGEVQQREYQQRECRSCSKVTA